MPFVHGEVDAVIKRDSRLLFEDDFNNGPNGWVGMMEVARPQAVHCLDSEISYNGSRYSMWVSTDDSSENATKNWGTATLIKRLSRGPELGKVYFEAWWSWGALHGQDSPRAYEFGLDQADPDGNRRYFKFRWHNYDEATATRVTRYAVRDSGGGFTPIPGAVIDHGINENKRNLHHFEAIFDVDAGVYDGLRVNGQGFGSLAATPDNSLRAYGPPAETLDVFKGGLNFSFDIRNRYDTNNTKAWGNLAYARGVLL